MPLPDQIETPENLAIQTTVLDSRDRVWVPERFVDAREASRFLSMKPRRVVEFARTGYLPAYPLGTGRRRIWRFRLSELADAITRKKSSR